MPWLSPLPLPFGTASRPFRSVPMKLRMMVTRVVFGPKMSIPSPSLPEITLSSISVSPAGGSGPDGELIEMPSPPLAAAALPAGLVPM